MANETDDLFDLDDTPAEQPKLIVATPKVATPPVTKAPVPAKPKVPLVPKIVGPVAKATAAKVAEVATKEAPKYTGKMMNGYGLRDVKNRPDLLSDGIPVTDENMTHQYMERVRDDRKMYNYVQAFFIRKQYPSDHPYWKVQ